MAVFSVLQEKDTKGCDWLMKLDTELPGLIGLYKPHTAKILQRFWALGANRVSIKETHKWFNERAEAWGLSKKSKAAVRDSLKILEDDGVIGHTVESGKGGYTRVYHLVQQPDVFSLGVMEKVVGKLTEMFSEKWWGL